MSIIYIIPYITLDIDWIIRSYKLLNLHLFLKILKNETHQIMGANAFDHDGIKFNDLKNTLFRYFCWVALFQLSTQPF